MYPVLHSTSAPQAPISPATRRSSRLRGVTGPASSRQPMKKPRPLQKNLASKRSAARNLASKRAAEMVKTASLPEKRQRTEQEEGNGTAPDGSPARLSRRVSSPNATTNGSTSRTEHQRPMNATHPTDDVGEHRVINAVRPGIRRDTLPPPPPAAVLTREQVLEMLKASEQRILKHIVSQQRGVLERIEAVEDLVKDIPVTVSAVKSSVEDLKIMIIAATHKSTKTNSQRTSTHSGIKSKVLTLQKGIVSSNPTILAELKIMFATDIPAVAAAKTVVTQTLRFHRNMESISISSRAMNVFLYSCKRLGKAVMMEGIGFRNSEFRYKVVRTMFELAKCLPDQLFLQGMRNSSDEHEPDSTRVSRKPTWLTSGLVDRAAFAQARKHHEWFLSDLPKDPTSPEKRKALYIAKRFFKQGVDLFRQSRDKSKVKMCEDGLYCLLDWEKLKGFPSELSNPTVSFVSPEEDVIPPSTIPETAVGDHDDAHSTNSELLQELIWSRKEMLIEAKYDVIVSKEQNAKARREDPNRERKEMRRVINILRIAKSFLCGFCQIKEYTLLRAHPAILQCLYRFALVIREMFMDNIYEMGTTRTSTRDAQEASVQQTTAGGQPSPSSNPEPSPTSTERTGAPDRRMNRNGAPQTSGNENDEGEHSSQRRQEPGNAERDTNGNERRQTPLLLLSTLRPAASEIDRVIENNVNLSYDAYDRLHDGLRSESDNLRRDRPGTSHTEHDSNSDTGDDDYSDMED